jgi:hypothetical protein
MPIAMLVITSATNMREGPKVEVIASAECVTQARSI